MCDLMDELRSRPEFLGAPLQGPVEAVAARLGAVTECEARELYRVAAEGRGPPELADAPAYLIEPLVLFGPDYVIEVIKGIRRGTVEPPAQAEPHVELLPEYWDDGEWDYGDPSWEE